MLGYGWGFCLGFLHVSTCFNRNLQIVPLIIHQLTEVNTLIYKHKYTRQIYMNVCMCMHVYVYVCMCVLCVCIYIYIHMCVCVCFMCMYVYTYMHRIIYTCRG